MPIQELELFRSKPITYAAIRMFWMMIIARGIAGFGAGGEYPVCATSATEAADETVHLRKRRGFLVALTTDFAIDLVSNSTMSMGTLLILR